MKAKPAPVADELRMKASDFDRIMRGALAVSPPPTEPKTTRKKTATKKKSGKK